MDMIRGNRDKGFTLIELLITISIMGLLAAIIMPNLSTAQQKARNAQRMSDLKEIQIALEAYYAENGVYPPLPTGWAPEGPTWSGECWLAGGFANDAVIPGLVPRYIPRLPSDPRMNTYTCYMYFTNATRQDYAVIDYGLPFVEPNFNITSFPTSMIDPRRDGGTDVCTLEFPIQNSNNVALKVYSRDNGDNSGDTGSGFGGWPGTNPKCW